MKSRSILNSIVALSSLAIAGAALGETYTFTGPSNGLWSNPLNWAGGIIPVSAVDSTIVNLAGVQDLAPEFDVGTLDHPVPPIGVTGGWVRVHQSVVGGGMQYYEYWSDFRRITTVGNVAMIDEFAPYANPGIPRMSNIIWSKDLTSSLDFTGGWRIDDFDGSGSIHLNYLTSLDAYRVNLQLTSLTGSGLFDLKGTIQMTGGVPADLTQGIVDLGRNDGTLGGNVSGEMTIDGDLKLGGYLVHGEGSTGIGHQRMDKIFVTGELDLTEAYIYPGSHVHLYGMLHPPVDHFIIGTYGNRIGEFPYASVSFGVNSVPMTLHYTTPENSGPGEIWLVVPEPSCMALAALMVPCALRRFRVASDQ